ARFSLLKPFHRCPVLKGIPSGMADDMEYTLPLPEETSPEYPVFLITAAETLRVIGRSASSRKLLNIAESRFLEQENMYALMKVHRVMDRTGWESFKPDSETNRQILGFLQGLTDYHVLRGAGYLDLANRLLVAGDLENAQESFDLARKSIKGESWIPHLNSELYFLGEKLKQGQTDKVKKPRPKKKGKDPKRSVVRSIKSNTKSGESPCFIVRIDHDSSYEIRIEQRVRGD
ncbi:MAG: hypothetical protein GY940_21520, partial [bacterium]|nr:hypothetical protein [bacterium]